MGAEAENKFSTLLDSLIIARAKLEIMELLELLIVNTRDYLG